MRGNHFVFFELREALCGLNRTRTLARCSRYLSCAWLHLFFLISIFQYVRYFGGGGGDFCGVSRKHRVAMESELMEDDSSRAHEGKERVRRGMINRDEFAKIMRELITDSRGSGGLGRQPWSSPGSPFRKSGSDPLSPTRPGPSPAGTPLRDPKQPAAGVNHGGAGLGGRGVSVPPSTSAMDSSSTVSNTSTVLTDLSTRLEKVEGMFTRLLVADKISSRPCGIGGAAAGAAE